MSEWICRRRFLLLRNGDELSDKDRAGARRHGRDDQAASEGNARVLEAQPQVERVDGRIQWQGPLADETAYGFRDFKFLRLKIFDLPSTDTKRHL